MLKYALFFHKPPNTNIMKKGDQKVSHGNIHLAMKTKDAQELLKRMGSMLTKTLSKYLGGAEVRPMVQKCSDVEGKWRLMFSIPKDVDTRSLNVHNHGVSTRIWGVPVSLLADNGTREFLASMSSYQSSVRFDKKGDVAVRLTFTEHDEMARSFEQAKGLGLMAKQVQKPRRGTAQPGFNIVVPVLSQPDKKHATQDEGFTAESVYEFVLKGLAMLPDERKQGLIYDVMMTMGDQDKLKLVGTVLLDDVGLYNIKMPFKQNGVGMVVNKLVFEEEEV